MMHAALTVERLGGGAGHLGGRPYGLRHVPAGRGCLLVSAPTPQTAFEWSEHERAAECTRYCHARARTCGGSPLTVLNRYIHRARGII